MPVGGNILLKYGGLPEPPTPDPDTPRRAWISFGIGLLILLAASLWAHAEPTSGRYALGGYSLLIVASFTLTRLYAGWQDDGLVGAFWAWRYPLGWQFMGERRSPLLTAWSTLGLISIVTASVINNTWP